MNKIQNIRTNLSYKVFVSVIEFILFIYCLLSASQLHEVVKENFSEIEEKQNLLNHLIKYDVANAYVNDKFVSTFASKRYVNDHYQILLDFISKEMINIKIKFNKLDVLLIKLNNITVLIAGFALFFDVPWSASIWCFIGALLGRIAMSTANHIAII
jgi:hypothetical protein